MPCLRMRAEMWEMCSVGRLRQCVVVLLYSVDSLLWSTFSCESRWKLSEMVCALVCSFQLPSLRCWRRPWTALSASVYSIPFTFSATRTQSLAILDWKLLRYPGSPQSTTSTMLFRRLLAASAIVTSVHAFKNASPFFMLSSGGDGKSTVGYAEPLSLL